MMGSEEWRWDQRVEDGDELVWWWVFVGDGPVVDV
jgi:hypothetical protein